LAASRLIILFSEMLNYIFHIICIFLKIQIKKIEKENREVVCFSICNISKQKKKINAEILNYGYCFVFNFVMGFASMIVDWCMRLSWRGGILRK